MLNPMNTTTHTPRPTRFAQSSFVRGIRKALTAAALLAMPLATGCIVHSGPGSAAIYTGELVFDWTFEGTSSCGLADVIDVDVKVFNGFGDRVVAHTADCISGGVSLDGLDPDSYRIELEAYDVAGDLRYAGTLTADVYEGAVTDLGRVDLLQVAAPRSADVAFDWGFLYPTNDSVVNACDIAGVDQVDVEFTPRHAGGSNFVETYDCRGSGIELTALVPGTYDVRLTGWNTYRGGEVMLYTSDLLEVNLQPRTTTDLGEITMRRVDAAFTDFEIAWTVDGGCRRGDRVDVLITRLNTGIEDDAFVVDCGAAWAVRETFVPGNYRIDAHIVGTPRLSDGIDVEIGSGERVNIDLVLQ